jgi:hypothetical protein
MGAYLCHPHRPHVTHESKLQVMPQCLAETYCTAGGTDPSGTSTSKSETDARPVTEAMSATSEAHASDAYAMDVQEILAERTTALGETEVLVVFKTAWIALTDLVSNANVQHFIAAPKCKYSSSAGALLLPIQPGSSLAKDVAYATAVAAEFIASMHARGGNAAAAAHRRVNMSRREKLTAARRKWEEQQRRNMDAR